MIQHRTPTKTDIKKGRGGCSRCHRAAVTIIESKGRRAFCQQHLEEWIEAFQRAIDNPLCGVCSRPLLRLVAEQDPQVLYCEECGELPMTNLEFDW